MRAKRSAFFKGKRDGRRKRYNPPSKGTSWRKTSLAGAALGLLGGPQAALLGGLLGALAGNTDSEMRSKRRNRGAYHAGNRLGRKQKKRRRRTSKVVVVYHRRRY